VGYVREGKPFNTGKGGFHNAKDTGDWVVFTSRTSNSSTYNFKESEGVAIEFISTTKKLI
jgi:hypothetical protein